MKIKEFIRSQTFKGVIVGLSIAILGLVIFQAGLIVGERKMMFGERFGGNFERNFRNPEGRSGALFGLPGEGLMPGGHGGVGEIINIALPNIVVAGPDNLEKTIVTNQSTIIREFQTEIGVADLAVGDHIVTFGVPNEDGEIEAKLIRVLPMPDININNLPTR